MLTCLGSPVRCKVQHGRRVLEDGVEPGESSLTAEEGGGQLEASLPLRNRSGVTFDPGHVLLPVM